MLALFSGEAALCPLIEARSTFLKRTPARERRTAVTSDLLPLQAAFPKTVPKTFSRNDVISTEL